MLKRIRWMSLGALVGFGGTLWVQRKTRALANRLRPGSVVARAVARDRTARRRWPQGVGITARTVGTDLRSALADRRQAVRDRERELRAQFDRATRPQHRRRRDHPAAARDHPSAGPPHLHLVEAASDGSVAAEEPARRR